MRFKEDSKIQGVLDINFTIDNFFFKKYYTITGELKK